MDKADSIGKSDQDARVTLWELIKDIRFAMLTTHHAEGQLRSRPVTTQNRSIDEDESLWFFLSKGSEPVADIAGNPKVNLAYADTDSDRYVSVTGTAAVVDDEGKKRSLWNRMAEAWFPKGVDDPDLALVEVSIESAEYWNVRDSKITQLFKMAKAAVTGRRPRDMGEHREVRMH